MASSGRHGTKAVVVALVANSAMAGAKLAAFLATGAVSLLATGAQSAADAGSQGLLLLGGRRSRGSGDAGGPFGQGREHHFWPFVGAIALFLLGSLYAIDQGIGQLRDPEPLSDPEWAYGVLGLGIVIQALGLRAAATGADQVRGRAGWTRFVRNAPSPELPVTLVTHIGSLVGLVLALGSVITAELTGDPAWDGIGALAVGALLGLVALALLVEMKSLLIGETATRRDVEAITAAIEVDPAVRRLIYLRAQQMGPGGLLVGAKVELDHTLTFPEVCEVVHRIERNVRANVSTARTMYIEPAVPDERRAAPAVGTHEPGHEVPSEIRARLEAEARKGTLGENIPVEPDL